MTTTPASPRKITLYLGILCVAAGLVGIVRMAVAGAHVPAVSASCDRLTVQLKDYERRSTVIVTIGGAQTTERFDRNYTRTFTGLGAYTVIVDNNGDGYDSEWSGMLTACGSGATGPTPTTSTPSSGATGPAPTTTSTSTTTTTRVIELIPPITAPPTTRVQVIDVPPVVTAPPAEVLAAVEVPLPPTVLARTGIAAGAGASIGLALIIFGAGALVIRRRATAR